MDFIEKVKAAEINEEYDMAIMEMRRIIDATAGPWVELLGSQFYEAIHLGFNYGYMQGMKAAAGTKPVENPKRKSEYRDATHSNLKRIKDLGDLKTLYKLSQLLADLNGDDFSSKDYELGVVVYFLLDKDLTEKNIRCIGSLLFGLTEGGSAK